MGWLRKHGDISFPSLAPDQEERHKKWKTTPGDVPLGGR
jgi:hypothetical protein